MGAEHSAVDVRLVHHDVAEVLQDVSPTVVMRKDANVEHVGVREDQIRPLADLPAALGLRVPVVDGRPQSRHPVGGQGPRLVLCERLGRIEVERPELRLCRERVQHG
jgi:hypothetical protein